MRKTLLLAILLFSSFLGFSQSGTAIFSLRSDGTINTNNQFLNPWDNDPRLPTLKYSLSNPITVGSYVVKTGRFTGWGDADPGYYVIDISKNGQSKLLLKHTEGFTRLNDPDNFYGQKLRKYANNDFFIEAPLENGNRALIFVGWPYGTDVAQLLIIVLTQNDVKLVYNKRMEINSITKTATTFSMEVQSNIQESPAPDQPFSPAITHRIWVENGVLRFANN